MGDEAPVFKSEEKHEDFLVLEENWPAINLYVQCQTQWNYLNGMGGAAKVGLNYQSVESVMRLCYAEHDQSDLFNRLQVIEREALKAEDG